MKVIDISDQTIQLNLEEYEALELLRTLQYIDDQKGLFNSTKVLYNLLKKRVDVIELYDDPDSKQKCKELSL